MKKVFAQLRSAGYLTILLLFSHTLQAQYYCTPYGLDCSFGDNIYNFLLPGELSTSLNDPFTACSYYYGGYDNRTAESVTLAAGGTYTITANNSGYGYSPYSGSVFDDMQVYIDLNSDFTFDVPTETVGGISLLATYPASSNIVISIPSSAPLGTHRMRVAVIDESEAYYPNIDPCGGSYYYSYFFGEIRDYTVNIIAGCTAPTLTLGTAACNSQVINWTAISGAAGYEYVTDMSSSAPTGSGTAVTATTYTASGLLPGTTYYAHVRTHCSGSTYSSWTTIPFTTPGPLPITGTAAVCPGSITQLSDPTAGGTWSSSSTSVATVSGSGTVYGVATGTAVISYTEGGCSAVTTATVSNLPSITGATTLCPGSTTNLSDIAPGGTWSSSDNSVATVTAGVVHGVTTGTAVITYSDGGCITTTTINVSTLPPITGGTAVCAGATLTLSDALGGGSWSSLSTAIATVSASGVVTGAAAGTVVIDYSISGCSVTETVTVGNAIQPITGTTIFCYNATATLSDATPGGTWSSADASVATIASSGTVVHGVSAGTDVISYGVGGCYTTTTVTLDTNNAGTITGSTSVCVGHTINLSDNVSGGSWSSSFTSRATVDPAGNVTGVSPGPVTIRYVVSNTCGTYTASYVVSVVSSGSACTTGITASQSQYEGLKVFPNPNGGNFVMYLSANINEDVTVVITNLIGQKVKEFKTETNNDTDVKIGIPGIYLLTATTARGDRYVAKVIVER